MSNTVDKNFEKSAENWIKGQELRIEYIKSNIENDKVMISLHEKSLELLNENLNHEIKCLADYKQFLKDGL